MINSFLGIPVLVAPKSIRVKHTWRQRLYMRPLWPFGSVKYKWKSILDDDTAYIWQGDNQRKIFCSEAFLINLKRTLVCDIY